jgi:hypothetical protein
MKRPDYRCVRAALVACAVLVAACSDPAGSPVVVEPSAIGSWESTEQLEDAKLRITLTNGQTFEIDSTHDQRALAFASAPGADTVLAVGDGPNGRWWLLSDIQPPGGTIPVGCHLIIAAGYDEPESVVLLAPPDSGKGFGADFGIRLAKAPGVTLATPPPDNPPFFGRLNRYCLDANGFVTSVNR